MQIVAYKTVESEQSPVILTVDAFFYHYLQKELEISAFFKKNFCKTQGGHNFVFVLAPTVCDTIDYKWNYRATEMVMERCELEHALSWFSTLGGAFSALGDYYEKCALIAAKISVNQLRLALRLGDPNIEARCKLYFSLSLIQQRRFKLAKRIILEEFNKAKKCVIVDQRLIKMCQGIWSKLKYEKGLYLK